MVERVHWRGRGTGIGADDQRTAGPVGDGRSGGGGRVLDGRVVDGAVGGLVGERALFGRAAMGGGLEEPSRSGGGKRATRDPADVRVVRAAAGGDVVFPGAARPLRAADAGSRGSAVGV